MAEEKRITEQPEKEEPKSTQKTGKFLEYLPEEAQKALAYAEASEVLLDKLKKGEISIPEAIILSSWWERKGETGKQEALLQHLSGQREKLSLAEMMLLDSWMERKDEKRHRTQNSDITLDKIKAIVEETIEKRLGKPKEVEFFESKTSELRNQISELATQLGEIRKRLLKEEEEKEKSELMQKFQQPILEKIEKAEEKRQQLEKELEELKNKGSFTTAQAESLTDSVSKLRKTLEDIKETARLMGMKPTEEIEKPQSLYQNIPVTGSIPAWAVAIPQVINQIFENIEKRAELWLKPPAQEQLLKLPPPPRGTPKIEGPLLRFPQPPIQPPPPPQQTPTAQPEQKPEVKLLQLPKPPEKPKEYKCKICGAVFNKPYLLASHTKSHKKKKEETSKRKTEEKGEPSQKKESTTPTKSSQTSEKQ